MQIGNTTFDVNAAVAALVFASIVVVCLTVGLGNLIHHAVILIRGYPPQQVVSLSEQSVLELSDGIAKQVCENIAIFMGEPNEEEEEEQHPEPSTSGA
jgi:hypothetical protein